MARGVARIILVGNVGKDPDMQYSQNGTAITRFSLAVNRQRRGDTESQADWYKVTAFGKLAEIVDEYVNKGTQVYVDGRAEINQWSGNDGIERTSVDVIADNIVMLGTKDENHSQLAQQPQRKPASDDLDDLPF